MKIRISYLTALIPVLWVFTTTGLSGQKTSPHTPSFQPGDTLPFDSSVLKGRLENGLTYYVRENHKPENRAQVWLAVNAGSVLEDEDQRGLAHFVEHMAFNGTEKFAKHEIIDYLESIGMKFGPEINAYTGFDETVFMLQLPTDTAGVLEQGIEILRQWAGKLSFDEEEIEKERGVVIEEWRLGRGAGMRMFNKQIPYVFKGSRYADRLPIGTLENLETFRYESLKRFYHEWYRPELMAVIAVGDIEAGPILDLIRDKFSGLQSVVNPRSRVVFPVPDHKETLYAIATDLEATGTSVSVFYKKEVPSELTLRDYRRMLSEQLFSRMLNLRFYELLNQADPPYLHAYISNYNLVRSKSVCSLNVRVHEDGIERGLQAALTEAIRVQKYGFTESELARTKTWLTRRMENAYRERDKTESSSLASEYLRNFLEYEPVPGIQYEYAAVRELLPKITLEEVNRLAGKWLRDQNRVVLLNAPDKPGLKIPAEGALGDILDSVEKIDVQPYVDVNPEQPLMEKLKPNAGILSESVNPELDLNTWELSNGIKVILKPTDFKNDEVLFQGFSPGGTSLVGDGQYRSSVAAADLISLSGVGDFDLNALNKKLSGKVVTVFPYINELSEGMIGSASPRDLETMFQLIYLYMTRPRKDSSAYLSYRTRMKGNIENRFSDPEAAFYDTLTVTMASYHYRRRPWSLELLDEIDPQESYEIYVDRFKDAGDFTFVFVGNFKPDSIKPLILTYLGSLPSGGRKETWKDINVKLPEGIIEKSVLRGLEPKSRVSLNFTGKFDWSRENNYAIHSMASVLRIKLREILREDLSGTYGTSVSAAAYLQPKQEYRLGISFGCDPGRTDELIGTVFAVIDSLQNYPVDPVYLTKVRENQKRSFETSLKQNRFWLSSLVWYAQQGWDPGLILQYPELVETLSDEMVREAARKYFRTDNFVLVVLKPAPDHREIP